MTTERIEGIAIWDAATGQLHSEAIVDGDETVWVNWAGEHVWKYGYSTDWQGEQKRAECACGWIGSWYTCRCCVVQDFHYHHEVVAK